MPSKHLPTDQNNQKHQEVNALAPHVERKENTAFVLWAKLKYFFDYTTNQ